MRLSGWRSKAPGKEGLAQKALESVGAILVSLGADADAHCWIIWGDETGSRWTLLAPCPAGLAVVNVRSGGLGEGSRASGRLIRWSKVQVGELAAESERGHRLVMFQIEGQPIRGTDDSAAEVAAFAGLALAGVEGRPLPNLDIVTKRPSAAAAKSTAAKAAPKKAGPAPTKASGKAASPPATKLPALRATNP